MYLIPTILSTIETAATVALFVIATIIWLAHLHFSRKDAEDRRARAIKERENLPLGWGKHQRQEEARELARLAMFHEQEVQRAGAERQRQAELRKMVQEEVAAQISSQETGDN